MKRKDIEIEPIEIKEESSDELILRLLHQNKEIVIGQLEPILEASPEFIRVVLVRLERRGLVKHMKKLVKQKDHDQFRNMVVWSLK